MGDVVDLQKWIKEQELKTPEINSDKNQPEEIPTLEEMSQVMNLATDELLLELIMRMNSNESIRDIPISLVIAELTHRVNCMQLLCKTASEIFE